MGYPVGNGPPVGYPVGSGPPVGYLVGSGPPVGYSVGPGKRQDMHAVQLENAVKLIRPSNLNSFSRHKLIAVLRFIIVFIWKLLKGGPFFMLFFFTCPLGCLVVV